MALRHRLAAALTLLTLVWDSSGAPLDASGQEPRSSLAAGFELAYNLDHDAAIETFAQIIASRPDDPAGYRSIAAVTWLRILFLRGDFLTDNYLTGSMNRPPDEIEEPPAALAATFHEHLERATELAEAAVRRAPDDPTAHYELGIAAALSASYRGSVLGERLGALAPARRAYAAHRKVLEIDPSRAEAKLLVGLYRYVVASMPLGLRWMAYLMGFDGGKEEAIELVAEAAATPGEIQAEARFALVLLYNRERRFARARRVLDQLRRTFPRNRLVWLETASAWLRDDRPAMAELTLAHGFAALQGDERRRMFGEDGMWHLKRGKARAALGLAGEARLDLGRAARAPAAPWVIGRAHLELGKLADLAGERNRARDHYARGRDLCGEAGDHGCERAAGRLRIRPYTGADASGAPPVRRHRHGRRGRR